MDATKIKQFIVRRLDGDSGWTVLDLQFDREGRGLRSCLVAEGMTLDDANAYARRLNEMNDA